ncbi:tautomerase family protein [Dyella sp. A6]|uniref:tautomerase family protein n=1 Tax=Dyella aluminiiresistens TaxID=3069105 RepID=UPI002E779089|nr:tautomerase family protein [Dyella sp. A6]
MPLVRIDVRRGRTPEELKILCDAVHRAVVQSFLVPVRDRYQIVHEHDAHTLVVEDTGLNIPRTDAVVVISIVSRPRGVRSKLHFYRTVCDELRSASGVESSDVLVNISTNDDDDWSFGLGSAQFVEGAL